MYWGNKQGNALLGKNVNFSYAGCVNGYITWEVREKDRAESTVSMREWQEI